MVNKILKRKPGKHVPNHGATISVLSAPFHYLVNGDILRFHHEVKQGFGHKYPLVIIDGRLINVGIRVGKQVN